MKTILLTTTFLAAGVMGLFAQGKVSLDNQPFNFPDSIENGGGVDYKIYYAGGMTPGNEVADAAWTAVLVQNGTEIGPKIPFYGAAFPGVWDVGQDPDSGVRTLQTGLGAATQLQVRIYNGAGAVQGTSDPFNYIAPVSANPPPDALFISNFRGFSVPEPSTVALGVLGLGALLLFRRRK